MEIIETKATSVQAVIPDALVVPTQSSLHFVQERTDLLPSSTPPIVNTPPERPRFEGFLIQPMGPGTLSFGYGKAPSNPNCFPILKPFELSFQDVDIPRGLFVDKYGKLTLRIPLNPMQESRLNSLRLYLQENTTPAIEITNPIRMSDNVPCIFMSPPGAVLNNLLGVPFFLTCCLDLGMLYCFQNKYIFRMNIRNVQAGRTPLYGPTRAK